MFDIFFPKDNLLQYYYIVNFCVINIVINTHLVSPVQINKGMFMSSNHFNYKNRQCWSNPAQHKLSPYYKNKHEHQSRSLSSIAGFTLLIGSTSLTLLGCQSTPTITPSTNASGALIDFKEANPVQSQAQGQAFTDNLTS